MKKIIILILFLIYFQYDLLSFGIFGGDIFGIDNANFNHQNQLVLSWYQTDQKNFGNEYLQKYNILIGIRTSSNENPTLIGRIMYVQESVIIPFVDKNAPLIPGGRNYTFWNSIIKATILDCDMTDLEELYIKWFHIQKGYGFDTYQLNSTDKILYHAFLSGKLGLSSITYGNNNFQNKTDNLTHLLSLESGIKLNTGVSLKRHLFSEANIDYTFFIAKEIVHKISYGIKTDYYYPIFLDYYGNNLDYIKFSLGINYNKYYFDKYNEEFLKLDFGIKYFLD